jgi:putative transposase
VPLASGFMYLAAVIDWFSRYVIAWRLSNTLVGSFGLGMLEEALGRGRPEVFNTDQGVPFTAQAWTGRLEAAGVAVSMDGRGRCLDNVFVERLWRTVKYEDIYLRGYEAVPELQRGLGRYFPYYNGERLHQALGYRTPAAVYRAGSRGEQQRHSFPPRPPSAPVKGGRGGKECLGAGGGGARVRTDVGERSSPGL